MRRTDPHQSGTDEAPVLTNAEARRIFDQIALAEPDPEKRANIELCREYFTNPKFRRWLEDETARSLGITE